MEYGQHYQGTVFKKATGTYWVDVNGTTYTCSASTKLRKELIYPDRDRSSLGYLNVSKVADIQEVDPIAVGDHVTLMDGGNHEGMIIEVHERHSKLTRRATGHKPLEHVLVANVDQVVAVFAATNPPPKWGLLDRYLASAEASDMPVILCINKIDLLPEKKRARKLEPMLDVYRAMEYPVILTSAVDGTGVESLRAVLKDKVSALVGMSGMGKSTLLNAMQPGLGLAVNAINEKLSKGRHTTTNAERFTLEFGGAVIDTPGIKVFGLWQIEKTEVAMLFRDMAPYVGQCKFGMSCSHEHEPDCAIKAAVEAGDISASRYNSYLYLKDKLYSEY